MKLSRDRIQRMVDARGNNATGVGAGISEQDINNILANYGTKEWVGENYLSIEWFNSLFNAVDSNGDPILPNDGNTSNIDSIKAMFGFWTEQYISALGQGDDGGGGGAGDVTWTLLADSNDTRPIALSHLTTALATYATQSWVQSQGYATQTWVTDTALTGYATQSWVQSQGYVTTAAVNALEFLNNVTGGNGLVTLSTNKSNSFVVDLTHQHSWYEIQDRPTTIAGFGITDASISNGIITIGTNTITPVTQVALTMPTGFSVSGSPVTKTGTFAITFDTGYEGFTTALKQKIEALYSWFEVDNDGNIKTKDYTENDETKHRGFYSPSFISALGQGDDGGGGGAGDVTWALLADSNDTRPIALSHLTTALATYATQTWVQSQGYATLAQLNALEYLATVTQGDGYVTLTSNKNTNYIVDLTHEHSWFEIQDRPTTLADYGVKDELDTILSDYLATSALRSLTFYGDGNTIGTYIPTAAMTVDFVSGTNISISRDATNHKLTINNTYQHPTGGADTTILSQDGRVLSSISVNAFGHVTSVGYKTLSMADMPAAMKYFNTITTTADGSLTFIGYNTPDSVVDLTHQHSWFEIQDRPTSLAEFGISADDPLLKDNYLTIEFFSALFKAYAGTTEIRPNGSTSTVDNIKAMFGFWTSQYLSALGLGADGQAGTFDESQMWQALGTDSSSKQISAAYLTNATRYNAITIADGGITFSGIGVTNTTVDLTHDHCFGELKATPDSLAGYGIIDAYILGTKIYLGNQSIDVSGGQVDLSGYATQSWVQTYYQPVGNYLTSASLDGFVSRSGSAMYTDAVISRTGSSVMWVQGRSYPIIKTVSYTGYNAILSMKTTNGSWDLGVYSDNTAYLTYITDTDYNNINNNITYQLTFPKDSGTIALTKNIPTSLPASDVYSWAKQPSKPSYSWSEISSKPNVAIQKEHNNLTASGNEFTTAASGQSGLYYWNYRTAGGLNGSITEYIFCNGSTGKAQLNAASITANGYLYSVSNGITVQIGAQNSSWAHITNSGGLSFWFGNPICTQGAVYPYVSDAYTLGTSSYYWSTAYIKNINIGSNLYYGTSFGINMNNSDIIGCNSIRTLDLSDDYTEALMFARTNGNWDSFRASDGNFYFHVNNGTTVSMLNADGLYVYNGWLRTTGATGWYSETYGGGWYMEDATWIRSYNGKYVWVDSYLCSEHISAGTPSINSSYALYVSGVGYFSSGVYSAGYVTALSDIRKKNVLSYNLDIDVYNVANAPAIKFTWIDGDDTEQVGTIAQYWKNILPQVVVEENDIDRTLSMDYGVTALVSVIATARKVVDHETRIRKLEQENEELRKQISQLKAA